MCGEILRRHNIFSLEKVWLDHKSSSEKVWPHYKNSLEFLCSCACYT